MDGRLIVDRQFVEPGRHRTALLQPPDALLHRRAAAVRLTVEPHPPVVGLLVLAAGDHRLDAVPGQPTPDPAIAIPLVPGQLDRAAPGSAPTAPQPDLIQHGLELGGLMPLARRQGDR